MEIYLVRHGQTGGNVAHRHQAEKTPLTQLGRSQAAALAYELKEYKPTHLVTSTLVRAIETARVVGEVCNLMPETSPLFIELPRPHQLYGQHHSSFPSLFFYLKWYFGLEGKTDGESYTALRRRCAATRTYLTQFPPDARVVVVSHAVFINLFVAHLCRDKMLWPHTAAHTFWKVLSMPNAKITPILFDESLVSRGVCPWSVDR